MNGEDVHLIIVVDTQRARTSPAFPNLQLRARLSQKRSPRMVTTVSPPNGLTVGLKDETRGPCSYLNVSSAEK